MKFARSVGELRFVRLFKDRGENLLVVQHQRVEVAPVLSPQSYSHPPMRVVNVVLAGRGLIAPLMSPPPVSQEAGSWVVIHQLSSAERREVFLD